MKDILFHVYQKDELQFSTYRKHSIQTFFKSYVRQFVETTSTIAIRGALIPVDASCSSYRHIAYTVQSALYQLCHLLLPPIPFTHTIYYACSSLSFLSHTCFSSSASFHFSYASELRSIPTHISYFFPHSIVDHVRNGVINQLIFSKHQCAGKLISRLGFNEAIIVEILQLLKLIDQSIRKQ